MSEYSKGDRVVITRSSINMGVEGTVLNLEGSYVRVERDNCTDGIGWLYKADQLTKIADTPVSIEAQRLALVKAVDDANEKRIAAIHAHAEATSDLRAFNVHNPVKTTAQLMNEQKVGAVIRFSEREQFVKIDTAHWVRVFKNRGNAYNPKVYESDEFSGPFTVISEGVDL